MELGESSNTPWGRGPRAIYFMRNGQIAGVEVLPEGLTDTEAIERAKELFAERQQLTARYDGFEVWDKAVMFIAGRPMASAAFSASALCGLSISPASPMHTGPRNRPNPRCPPGVSKAQKKLDGPKSPKLRQARRDTQACNIDLLTIDGLVRYGSYITKWTGRPANVGPYAQPPHTFANQILSSDFELDHFADHGGGDDRVARASGLVGDAPRL